MNEINDYTKYMVPFYAPASFKVKKALGSLVWDKNNKKYIDFTAGIAVTNLGHSNKTLSSIIADQSKKVIHLSNLYINEPSINLAKKLCKKTFAEKVFFCNSGAEAVEASIKTARKFYSKEKNKNEIISFSGSFHGRTMMAIALSNNKSLTDGFAPLPKGVKNHKFNEIKDLEKKFSKNTCAVILELVQWQSGIISAENKFVKTIIKLCKKYKALLIIDEVQSGIGRTGSLFAYEKYKIKPDILCFAKGLANGLPIGGILTTHKISSRMNVGSHGTTFGGGPLVCAVGSKVLEIVSSKKLLNDVRKKEKIFIQRIKEINSNFDCFSNFSSSGLWLSIELKKDNFTVDDLIDKCHSNGLMILKANDSMVRFSPSLIIEDKIIDAGLEIFKKSIFQLMN